ncbi:MAG: Glutamine synthetase 3 [Alphaproteobacteria bacterium MarineAlpha5_Bin9]|nr:MAG: Glutamine synthetase 3 [Alphaproteobacteria bacterium MarineAlpha5_Bin9]|tara:strand:- start:2084 stop:3412 length:1329 start_codon:yes stop_codon:yes gene_type:complete
MPYNLKLIAKKKKIKYFLISFVDFFGVLRAKLVPAQAISEMQKDGAGFGGFAAYLDMPPSDPDVLAIPDPNSLIQLPWNPEVGWLASDLWLHGKPVQASPRIMLKEQIKLLSKKNLYLQSGVECEYFLLNPEGTEIADKFDIASKPCYDQSALMRQYDIIKEICDSMIKLGWGPYQNDHEDANGQFEMNWNFSHCLATADRHVFFKFMVKSIAEKHGYRATFMPKPFLNKTGNGCHAHLSLWNKSKKNMFINKKDNFGLTTLAYNFMGGIIYSAEALTAWFNPTINSYKRINAPVTHSGATWSPNTITYSNNNRTHMIRVPGPGRFEIRLMDGAVNPYLLQAGIIAAGIDGIENKRNPGKPIFLNMYEDSHKIKNLKKLPSSLEESLNFLEKNNVLNKAFGKDVIKSYIKLRNSEIENYKLSEGSFNSDKITSWEVKNTLDC